MSSSDPNSSIFLTDTPSQITNKIKKYAFSGAPKTLEELQANGCDLSVDIPYNYLRFFLEDQVKLNEIEYIYQYYLIIFYIILLIFYYCFFFIIS